MNIHLAAAYWRLGVLRTERLPEIAVEALESGLDSPSVRILAGERNCSKATGGPLYYLRLLRDCEQQIVLEAAKLLSER
jgi:hypothetical protein